MSKNLRVVNTTPSNQGVMDTKPKMQGGYLIETERLYQVIFNPGQSMGLLLALTYTTGGTVMSPITQ